MSPKRQRNKKKPIKKVEFAVLSLLDSGDKTQSEITKKLSNLKIDKESREKLVSSLLAFGEISDVTLPVIGRQGRQATTYALTDEGRSILNLIEKRELLVRG